MTKMAGIIIVGNEILSGKTVDVNSPYLCKELRRLGVDVQEICTIPDDVTRIAEVVCDFSSRFQIVFTSGGVGPTHDDVTIAGVAKAFQVNVIQHPVLIEILKGWYPDNLNEARSKMAEAPEGSELQGFNKLDFPVIVFKNVFIFPGVPEILKQKFEAIKEDFRDLPFFLKIIYVKIPEGTLAGYLNNVLNDYPKLLMGSYPESNNSEYRVKVTVESKDKEYLEAASERLIRTLPSDAIVKVEAV